MELMNSLHFHQAVIECAAVGIIIVDDDTRIINANPAALEILGKSSVDVLNRPVADLFDPEERTELISGLKQVKRQGDTKKVSFFVNLRCRLIGATVSTITMQDNVVGWIVVLVPSFLIEPNAPGA